MCKGVGYVAVGRGRRRRVGRPGGVADVRAARDARAPCGVSGIVGAKAGCILARCDSLRDEDCVAGVRRCVELDGMLCG